MGKCHFGHMPKKICRSLTNVRDVNGTHEIVFPLLTFHFIYFIISLLFLVLFIYHVLRVYVYLQYIILYISIRSANDSGSAIAS